MIRRPLVLHVVQAVFVAGIAFVLALTSLPGVSARPGDPGRGLALGQARKDAVIVRYRDRATAAGRGKTRRAVGATTVQRISPFDDDLVLMKLPPGQSVRQSLSILEEETSVAYAEPDYIVQPAESPDDPYYLSGQLWGMYGSGTDPSSEFGSGAAQAWAVGTVGASHVFVGVIDEGVKIDHPDLSANSWRNPVETANGVDDDGNGFVDDLYGWDFASDDASVYDGTGDDHGTHVAGTVGARGGNGLGVAGVNWRVTLLPVKFIGPAGGYVSDAVAAIRYVSDLKTRHGVDIVATNNS